MAVGLCFLRNGTPQEGGSNLRGSPSPFPFFCQPTHFSVQDPGGHYFPG